MPSPDTPGDREGHLSDPQLFRVQSPAVSLPGVPSAFEPKVCSLGKASSQRVARQCYKDLLVASLGPSHGQSLPEPVRLADFATSAYNLDSTPQLGLMTLPLAFTPRALPPPPPPTYPTQPTPWGSSCLPSFNLLLLLSSETLDPENNITRVHTLRFKYPNISHCAAESITETFIRRAWSVCSSLSQPLSQSHPRARL